MMRSQGLRELETLGFTLLELLLSIAILVVITSIVYATFAGVTNSVSVTRGLAEELRFRQFLAQSFQTNFSTAYSDQNYDQDVFRLIGISDETSEGPMDSVQFCSTAPLMGGLALPGDLKQVRFEAMKSLSSKMELSWEEEEEMESSPAVLVVSETPLLGADVHSLDQTSGAFLTEEDYESPAWSIPIRTFDVTYFDGVDWLEEWDSQEMGRIPWAARVRINFAKSDAELEKERDRGYSALDDPDFELVVPIPVGMGVQTDLRTQETDEEDTGAAQTEYIPSEGEPATSGQAGTVRESSESAAGQQNVQQSEVTPQRDTYIPAPSSGNRGQQ